jgi:hypothetical protein
MNRNTYDRGILTFLSYQGEDGAYVAACKELCLLVEAKDAQLAKLKILALSKRYLTNVCKEKLSEDLLNQNLPPAILDEFESHLKNFLKKKRMDDFQKWTQSWEQKSGKIKALTF